MKSTSTFEQTINNGRCKRELAVRISKGKKVIGTLVSVIWFNDNGRDIENTQSLHWKKYNGNDVLDIVFFQNSYFNSLLKFKN